MLKFFNSRPLAVAWLSGILLTGGNSLQGAAAWPIVTPELRPDPSWHWGVLPNGIRYVIRQSALPAGRVSYRLAVQVGAAHETGAENGFAHYVEHMGFNGTRRFPGETLAREMEKRGITFGPELAAFTFLTHTLYQFDAPGTTPAELDWMTGVLREFADGIQFEPKQVKRERGVIEAESRDRRSAGQRMDQARRRELYPLSPLSNRIEGDPALATAEKLRAFYQKWYRPEKMIIVLVGDAPVSALEAAIQHQFASLPARTDPAPKFDVGFLDNPAESTANVIHDAEAGGLWLEVASLLPSQADSLEERRRFIAASLATQVLTERLAVIARQQAGTYSQAGARIIAPTPHAIETNVFIQTNPQQWAEATATLARELRRTLELTLYPREIAQAKERILRAAEVSVRAESTADSPTLASWVLQEALWGQVSLGPKEYLRISQELLPSIDAVEVANAWRSFWQERRARIFGYGYFPVAAGGTLIGEKFAAESSLALEAPALPPKVAFPYDNFGPAGELRSRRHDPAVDIHMLEFANGVRVNLKQTAFAANQVDFAAAVGTGLQSVPPYKPALGPLASGAFLNGGLGRLPPEELHRVLSTEPMSLQFMVSDGRCEFTGTTTPPRLGLLLRLLCAYLTDPRWDAKAVAMAKTMQTGYHFELLKTAEGVLGLNAFHEATHRDPRYRAPTPAEVAAIDVPDLKNWLDPILRGAPLDIGLVGDFDPEAIIPLLAETVGALPKRETPRIEQFPVRFSKTATEQRFPAATLNNRAAVQILWPADQGRTIHGARRLEVLRAALNNRLLQRVREDMGAAYAPSVAFWNTKIGTEEGYLSAFVTTAPELAEKVRKLVLQEADKIARRGISATEFTDALNPILASSKVQLANNSYWLWNIALRAQSQPEVLGWPLTRIKEFEQINREEINSLAREVLSREHAQQFSAGPMNR